MSLEGVDKVEIVKYRGEPAIYLREESGMHLILYKDEIRLVADSVIERDIPEQDLRMLKITQLRYLHQIKEGAVESAVE